jgi:hypothetical protein
VDPWGKKKQSSATDPGKLNAKKIKSDLDSTEAEMIAATQIFNRTVKEEPSTSNDGYHL